MMIPVSKGSWFMAQPRLREDNIHETSLCAGHLLVWTWRKMVAGEESCPLITHEYEAVAGTRAYDVLDDLSAFLLLLGRGSRRVLSVGPPLCTGLTRDEGQILRLIAAAQMRDGAQVGAHLSWLVKSGSRESVRAALESLAASLSDCGMVLPRLHPTAPPGSPLLEVVR
jgi:hypothetical protein